MSSNYPPGVTGHEYAIAGADYEKDSDEICPKCVDNMVEEGYRGDRWIICLGCEYQKNLKPLAIPTGGGEGMRFIGLSVMLGLGIFLIVSLFTWLNLPEEQLKVLKAPALILATIGYITLGIVGVLMIIQAIVWGNKAMKEKP